MVQKLLLFIFEMMVTAAFLGCSQEGYDGFLSDNNEFVEINNAASRLLVFGQSLNDEGNRQIYFSATDATATGLSAREIIAEGIELTVDGRVLDSSSYTLEQASDGVLPFMSLSLVSDYSGSMSDKDIAVVKDLYLDFTEGIGGVFEGEYITFESEVVQRAPYGSSSDTVRSAISDDSGYARGGTSLYDGLNLAVQNVGNRSLAAKLIICSTDGVDNSSSMTNTALSTAIADSQVFVLMLGNLYADPDVLEELAGPRGIFVYAYALAEVAPIVSTVLEGIKDAVVVTIPAAIAGSSSAEISFQGNTVDHTF